MKHVRDIRLFNNAGMSIAVCVAAKEEPLDMEAEENNSIAPDKKEADCPECKKVYAERYGWAQ